MRLPTLLGSQSDVFALKDKGHFVVLGTAGSGKTTLAIYRALHLAKLMQAAGSTQRILLLTYNNSLTQYFQYLTEGNIPSNIDILVYHKFARGYLHSRGKMGSNTILRYKDPFIEQALSEFKEVDPQQTFWKRQAEFFVNEITWIQKMGISNLEEYQSVERVGRSEQRIQAKDRPLMFELYMQYLKKRSERSYTCDWDDMAQLVTEELSKDPSPRRYQHIVIDEGQDFSPVMLRSLARAIPPDGSFVFFGDVAQQIFGSRLSWRDAGIKVTGRVHRLKENHRNCAEIAAYAIAISQMPFYSSDEDMVMPLQVIARGPKPIITKFQSAEQEERGIQNLATRLKLQGSVAILVRDNETVDKILGLFRRGDCEKLEKRMRYHDSGIWTGTFHSAKGMEFHSVLMPFCSADVLPNANCVAAAGSLEDAMAEEAKLIYVGVTRARQNLIISYHGSLSPLFPTDPSIVTERTS